MNIFKTLIGFLEGGDNSLRIDSVRNRLREEDLHYMTIADSKKEMHDDMMRIRSDFHKAIKEASENVKTSRTKQD